MCSSDLLTMGSSVQWNARKEKGAKFPVQPWMLKFTEKSCCYLKHGDWDWETGMNRDQLGNLEYVRDYGMLAVYSNWAFIKNCGRRKAEWADLSLNWVAHVAGKRETRRLLGDHILCEQDIFENRPMKDGTCWTTWSVDLHYPMPENAMHFPVIRSARSAGTRSIPVVRFLTGRSIRGTLPICSWPDATYLSRTWRSERCA